MLVDGGSFGRVIADDERLVAWVEALGIPATVLGVERDPGSVVRVQPVSSVTTRLIAGEAAPDAIKCRVVPNLCRQAVDAALVGRYRADQIVAGGQHDEAEAAPPRGSLPAFGWALRERLQRRENLIVMPARIEVRAVVARPAVRSFRIMEERSRLVVELLGNEKESDVGRFERQPAGDAPLALPLEPVAGIGVLTRPFNKWSKRPKRTVQIVRLTQDRREGGRDDGVEWGPEIYVPNPASTGSYDKVLMEGDAVSTLPPLGKPANLTERNFAEAGAFLLSTGTGRPSSEPKTVSCFDLLAVKDCEHRLVTITVRARLREVNDVLGHVRPAALATVTKRHA